MNVGELMTTEIVTVGPETPVLEAMSLMDDREVRHLPVVERDQVVGIVSDRDLARFSRAALLARVGDGPAQLRTPVSRVMTGAPVLADVDDDVDELIAAMLDARIGAIPVVDPEGGLVGIVSVVDVLRAAVGRL